MLSANARSTAGRSSTRTERRRLAKLERRPQEYSMSGTCVRRWQEWSGSGLQHLVLREEPEKTVAEAAVIATEDAVFAAHYRIECDRSWRVRRAEATVLGDDRRVLLESDGLGRWRDGAGRPLPDLDGAFDVDLPITPFTNTL